MSIRYRAASLLSKPKWIWLVFSAIVLALALTALLLLVHHRPVPSSSEAEVSQSDSSAVLLESSLPEKAQKLRLLQHTLNLAVGDHFFLSFSLMDQEDGMPTASFHSADPSVAEVDDDGLITALSAGITRITVTLDNGLSDSMDLTVSPGSGRYPVSSITLSVTSVQLAVGQSKQPIVTMHPSNASDKSERWNSSNPAVATVDGSGSIRAVAPGKCTVTVASVSDPAVTADVAVIVSAAASTSPPPSSQKPEEPAGEFAAWNRSHGFSMMVINRDNPIPEGYRPQICTYQSFQVDERALPHLKELLSDAYEAGAGLWVASGYRDIALQTRLYNRKVDLFLNQGYDEAEARAKAATIVAKPGTSEHNTGLSVDFNNVDTDFCQTKGYRWLMAHAADYGFIQRYPTGKEDITHVIYEPWHFRYVGVENAKAIRDSGLCLEEYVRSVQ